MVKKLMLVTSLLAFSSAVIPTAEAMESPDENTPVRNTPARDKRVATPSAPKRARFVDPVMRNEEEIAEAGLDLDEIEPVHHRPRVLFIRTPNGGEE